MGESLEPWKTDKKELIKRAKSLEGKTTAQVCKEVVKEDDISRVITKATVGYALEKYFGIKKNSEGEPDFPRLGIELKTIPLKYDPSRKMLSVKEPLSLNIINYMEEHKCRDIKGSSFYKKNKKILLVCYIHDKGKKRSDYVIKYAFLWEMDEKVLEELKEDYDRIVGKIRAGRATDLHQHYDKYLTTCPKHGGVFHDKMSPRYKNAIRPQPFSRMPAEIRAFRLKNKYMNMVISSHLGKELQKGRWKA